MKLLTTAAVIALTASASFAETVRATITGIQPNYVTEQVEVIDRRCYNVEVPIYGTVQGDAAGGALAGMIIGGILGKGVTGKDDGAAAGAVIGGIIGADKGANGTRRVVTGYKTERQCSEVMVREEVRELKNYYITFKWQNLEGSAYTYNKFRVGDRIQLEANINAR